MAPAENPQTLAATPFEPSELIEYGKIEEITQQGTNSPRTPPTDTVTNYS